MKKTAGWAFVFCVFLLPSEAQLSQIAVIGPRVEWQDLVRSASFNAVVEYLGEKKVRITLGTQPSASVPSHEFKVIKLLPHLSTTNNHRLDVTVSWVPKAHDISGPPKAGDTFLLVDIEGIAIEDAFREGARPIDNRQTLKETTALKVGDRAVFSSSSFDARFWIFEGSTDGSIVHIRHLDEVEKILK